MLRLELNVGSCVVVIGRRRRLRHTSGCGTSESRKWKMISNISLVIIISASSIYFASASFWFILLMRRSRPFICPENLCLHKMKINSKKCINICKWHYYYNSLFSIYCLLRWDGCEVNRFMASWVMICLRLLLDKVLGFLIETHVSACSKQAKQLYFMCIPLTWTWVRSFLFAFWLLI